jgi:signal transduction histidine kinase
MIAASVLVATALPVTSGGWPGTVAVALAVLASLPVLWRRRSPIVVACVVGLGTTGLAFSHQLPPLPYGALVCTYTIAALSPPRWRLLATAVQAVGVVVSLIVPNEGLVDSGYVGMAFVTAYALGMGVRVRQAQIEMLEERARRLEDERVAVAATERTRIAQDMHDILAHSVGLMVVHAEAGPLAPAEQMPDTFEVIARTGREAIRQLRLILDALRPDGGRDPGAPVPGTHAVDGLVERLRQAGLEVSVERLGEPRPLPADVDIAAYRVIQESLTNVLRHSAGRARICLDWSPTALAVSVTDDGRAQLARRPAASGHGLIGMRERVTSSGGVFRAGPLPGGQGFAVTATFDLAELR